MDYSPYLEEIVDKLSIISSNQEKIIFILNSISSDVWDFAHFFALFANTLMVVCVISFIVGGLWWFFKQFIFKY